MILLRANDLMPDPRVEKYVNFYEKKGLDYVLIGWNRENKTLEKKNTIFYEKEAHHGLGDKNIKNLILWNIFLVKELIRNRKKYKVIHACDFDTILPALLMKIMGKKIIFDIFDWYTDCREFKNMYLKNFLNMLEKISVRLSDKIILCEEERKEQLKMNLNSNKIWIVPNIPKFDVEFKEFIQPNLENKIKISYVGILSDDRGLDILLEAVSKNKNIYLEIAGFGKLEFLVKKYSQCDNINFRGKISHSQGMQIMKDSDLIYAMYYKVNRNNIYAAPNKYYEGLFLEKPILTTKGILISDKTESDNTGFIVDEGNLELEKFLDNLILSKDLLKVKGQNAKAIWNNKYKNYLEEFFEKKYREYLLKWGEVK